MNQQTQHKLAFAHSSTQALHTQKITPPLLPFPQTNLREEIDDLAFSVWLLPVESPQAGFPNHQN